ncbi:ABC transporter permease [Paenibacillus sp. 1P07SE]|uniref:ABC transporter permease n=1 Tax=Paenibacillus sp. 1P07SE TaxID=3132209 RepID=UPI0039A45273
MQKENVVYRIIKNIKKQHVLYLLSLPTFIYIIIFEYFPIYGLQIAFKDFIAREGFLGSPWVGFEHFERFFNSYNFTQILINTLEISVYSLIFGFPLPILLALMLNELKHKMFKNSVQMITYAPHFISTVVLVGMLYVFASPNSGLINNMLQLFGIEPVSFLTDPSWFKPLYILSGIWQGIGWGSIIYMAALSGIDPQLYDAAMMDGASRLKKIWHIDIPGILPTIMILLILNVGQIMSVGFEKIFLMQNDLNIRSSDVIATYVYRMGIQNGDYSFSTAVGLFNSVVNFILLVIVNQAARRMGGQSLW